MQHIPRLPRRAGPLLANRDGELVESLLRHARRAGQDISELEPERAFSRQLALLGKHTGKRSHRGGGRRRWPRRGGRRIGIARRDRDVRMPSHLGREPRHFCVEDLSSQSHSGKRSKGGRGSSFLLSCSPPFDSSPFRPSQTLPFLKGLWAVGGCRARPGCVRLGRDDSLSCVGDGVEILQQKMEARPTTEMI